MMASRDMQEYRLSLGESMQGPDGISILFTWSGHEHVSRSPGEAFSATIAVFELECSYGERRERYRIEHDFLEVREKKHILMNLYSFMLLSKTTERELVFWLEKI